MFLSRILGPRVENITQKVLFTHYPTLQKRCREFSTEKTDDEDKDMSKAMKVYLARAKEHEIFMKQQTHEFQIGKRHLANMMGEDPETFTQEDIDNAITYLFPSGLFEKKARPFLKPPEEIFPQRKAAEFDSTGRPFHYLFYTGRPNFYELLHLIVHNIQEVNKFEDIMFRKGVLQDPNLTLDLSGYQWYDKQALEAVLLERISDVEYQHFINAMEALCKLPYSFRSKDFIMKYMRPLMSQASTMEAPQPSYDEDGRAYISVYDCTRKAARGTVTIRSPGTGRISINGQDITYFHDVQSREQILFPLLFTNMVGKVDIEGEVEGGGYSGQAGAIRWGIAWGLRTFVDVDTVEKMRLAGLLTKDFRTRERMKPGQPGARRKYTWKKR